MGLVCIPTTAASCRIFIRQAITGQDITLFGDGSQTRSFCYRDDLVEGFIRLMNCPDSFIGPVNIGNPGEFTIKELAELVIEMTGAKVALINKPLPGRRSGPAASRYRAGQETSAMGTEDSAT